VAQVMNPGSSCRDSVRRIEAWWRWEQWRGVKTLSEEAYCKARHRLGLPMLESILRQVAGRLEVNVLKQEQLLPGRTVKVVDGSSVSMPDTAELQKLWPQPSEQKPGCGFPVMRIVGIFSLASGALLERAAGSLRQAESVLFRSLWPTLKAGDVLLEDRGFCSYGTMALLQEQGVDTVARLHQARPDDLRQGRVLGSKDRLVTWKKPGQRPKGMSVEDYKALPPTLTVRLIGLEVSVPGWRTRRAVLTTTLTDVEKYPADLIRDLYLRRWQVEMHFAQIKTLLQMDILRTKSPQMIEKELLIGLIAYNLVRALMQRCAHLHHVPLERLSFQGCVDTLRHYAQVIRASIASPRKQEVLIHQMLERMAADLLPVRPHRSEPRARKRRSKNYQLLTRPREKMGRLPHRNRGTVKKHPKSPLS
jgi:Transposase DDE domain